MKSARRCFSLSDQYEFARLSGDYNPIHLDSIVARRLMFGVPIVHGVHLALWAIGEQGRSQDPRTLVSLKAVFLHPVSVGDEVECRWLPSINPSRIEVLSKGQVAARIDLNWSSYACPLSPPENKIPPVESPLDPARNSLAGSKGVLGLYLSVAVLEELLPEVARQLPASQVGNLLATTRLIGNHCPGLNSVYSSLALEFGSGQRQGLDFTVKSFDDRFGALALQLNGPGCSGTANVFLRPPPVLQPSFKSMQEMVEIGEFSGLKALVVGGSRGLGEVATKLLCAGGAVVTSTFFTGREDSNAVLNDVAAGGGRADAIRLDVTAPLPDELPAVDLLVFTSTPFIFAAVKGSFSGELFDRFCRHYVHGFAQLCARLAANRPLRVLYPSSSAVEEVPLNMGEYAAAKAAAEVTCKYLEGCYKGLRIHRPRFQRLATDQTGSIVPVHNANPVPAMLRELRIAVAP